MLFIETNSFDPHFNLAAEEYFVKNKSEEIFMLWRNGRSVIVGRNQNAMSEVSYDFVTDRNIPVVRRMSGGGAVFHDLENINYTYIVNCTENSPGFGNYEFFTGLLCSFLKKKGIDAYLSGRNDVLVDGRKISGNAQYKWKKRLMHHGTILVGADISELSGALTPDESKFLSKGIKSVKSRVANINEFLDIDAEKFFMEFKAEVLKNCEEYLITDEDIMAICHLCDEKYKTYEWNWGYSPKYNFSKKMHFAGGTVEVCFEISDAIIKTAKIYGDFFSAEGVEVIEEALKGIRHSIEDIEKAISKIWKEDIMGSISKEELISLMF